MDRKTRKLLKRLQHKDPKARYEAVLALGKTGNTELIEALDKVATLDEHAKVRELAGKAVRTLNTLQQREEAKKKAALKAQMSQEKFDWPTLAQERMLKQRDLTLTDEEWNYEKRLQKVREEKENTEREAKKAIQRRRRRFRIVLYLALAIAVIGLAAALSEYLDDTPEDTEEALTELQILVQDQQAALLKYCEVLAFDPAGGCQTPTGVGTLECKTLKEVNLPALPEWLKPDEPTLQGKDLLIDRINFTDERLRAIQSSIESQCSGKETFAVAEWPEYMNMSSAVVAGFNLANPAASEIQQELAALNSQSESTPEATPGS